MNDGPLAESVLGTIRSVLAFEDVDDHVKIETVALLASADLSTGDLTIAPGDRAALDRATGRAASRA